MRLNSPGASRLMAWPQFGITAKAAAGMFCFIKTPGIRQGQSSSPVRMSVGTVKRLISEKAPAQAIRDLALTEGMIPLRAAGVEKVAEDATTLSEVMRCVWIN